MKVVIPVKASSSRVPNKNFRPFHCDRSLFDIAVERILKVVAPGDVYMSCEDHRRAELADRWGINFLPRDPRLAENATPLGDVVRGVCADVPDDDDVMWAHVCDPLFDAYAECADAWTRVRADHDSLVVVHPVRGYLLNADFAPIGFGFGVWHVPSQQLPAMYRLGFTLSILSRHSIARVGYPVGERPYWFVGDEDTVDIDTEQDFRTAQLLYRSVAEGDRR
jgi:CMP-N-acetylneuraminic acid synthetase